MTCSYWLTQLKLKYDIEVLDKGKNKYINKYEIDKNMVVSRTTKKLLENDNIE